MKNIKKSEEQFNGFTYIFDFPSFLPQKKWGRLSFIIYWLFRIACLKNYLSQTKRVLLWWSNSFCTHTIQKAILQDWHVKLGVFFKSTKFWVIYVIKSFMLLVAVARLWNTRVFRDFEFCWHFVWNNCQFELAKNCFKIIWEKNQEVSKSKFVRKRSFHVHRLSSITKCTQFYMFLFEWCRDAWHV